MKLIVKYLFIVSCFFILTSCATLKNMICDCSDVSTSSREKTKTVKSASKAELPAEPVIALEVNEAQEMLAGDIYTAMDAFVFKNENKKILIFCQSNQVQCWLNEKKWPKGKKLDRKILKKSPYMTGSKMGLRGESRIQIRWEFYNLK